MLDFIGIGLGPFNLSLASLLHQKTKKSYIFFEKKVQFDWHAGMQLPNTILQVPFMADLVSMVDPTSPLSFLNYLKHQQRLYKFYFLEQSHIPRREYNHYCQWVADQLDNIQYQSNVLAIYPKDVGFEVVVEQRGITHRYRCRNLVIGPGNVPRLPECLEKIQNIEQVQCIHSAEYMTHRKNQFTGNVVVLGSGQSAAEVFQDLLERQAVEDSDHAPFNLHWLTRSPGFFPMEYAPLGLEHFSPDYVNHFFELSDTAKQDQLKEQSLLYKGISAKTIQAIYQKLYHMTIGQKRSSTHLHQHAELIDAKVFDDHKVRLYFRHKSTGSEFYLDADHVIAATGYHAPQFDFLSQLTPLIEKNEHGHWMISKNYRLKYTGQGQIFGQNLEMHSHGVVTPDLGMGAYRAAIIANQLVGCELYEVGQQAQCFQHFDPESNPHIQVYQPHLKALMPQKTASEAQKKSFNVYSEQVYSEQMHSEQVHPKHVYPEHQNANMQHTYYEKSI
ncbi:MAG: SidA/IucD/PvdA family monooxygenase [Candidatus Acinetobacter avistercoris]|nr:SidA/IucD/PvdA family monooxygenase [Candidatus Acinetobacter avistercoris]